MNPSTGCICAEKLLTFGVAASRQLTVVKNRREGLGGKECGKFCLLSFIKALI